MCTSISPQLSHRCHIIFTFFTARSAAIFFTQLFHPAPPGTRHRPNTGTRHHPAPPHPGRPRRRRRRHKFSHPALATQGTRHPEPHPEPPGTGRAPAAPPTTPQILSPSPSYRWKSPPHAPTQLPTQLRLARPHASPARTTRTRNRNRFPGWGHKRTHPPTSNIYIYIGIGISIRFNLFEALL